MKHYRWHITYEFGRVNEKYFIIVTDSVRCLANIHCEFLVLTIAVNIKLVTILFPGTCFELFLETLSIQNLSDAEHFLL